MRPMKDNPCHGCEPPKRTPDCHAKCPDWIIAKAFHDAEREYQYDQAQVDQYSIDIARSNRERARKRKQSFKGHSWRHV